MQQSAELLEQIDRHMTRLLRLAEANRRERPTLNAAPLAAGVMDYSQSGTVMELAMAHLRESVPSGQRERTECAWIAMREAVRQQELWLRAKGYRV